MASTTARAGAVIVDMQANTTVRFYMRLRKLIAWQLPGYELSGKVEADQSYFGVTRKGKRGRGASGKVTMFGLLKRGGKVFTAIAPNARTETLLPIIEEKVTPDSIIFTDSFKAYNALNVTAFRYMRINHSKLFADRENHINSIENFWSQAKRHLRRFNGIKLENFHWFLKECAWRFNEGGHQTLFRQLKHWYSQKKH